MPGWMAFLKFGSLSGAGWLLDFSVLMMLVGGFGVSPFAANVVSSSIAALAVFLISRRLIFAGAEGGFEIRVVVYLAYTLCVIAVAAEAMSLLVHGLRALGEALDWRASPAMLAGLAKIAITPPTLILNFLMSRLVAERRFSERAWS